jgi:hypothetical protein
MNKPTRHPISIFAAIAFGHLVTTVPILLGFGIPLFLLLWSRNPFYFKLLCGLLLFVVAWLWWSFIVPRWRMWALRRGADPHDLQWWGVATGLVYPKGWIFERTEFRPKEYDDGLS